MRGFSSFVLLSLHLVAAVSPAPRDAHQVTSLPGLTESVNFQHFAGHLNLPTNESLFYWYAESQHDAKQDPLVLWLNGGPGCSSLGGFFTENGPFVVQGDLTLKRNHYAWNRKANVVWVESPAGVGFSGPMQSLEYYNDDVVANRMRQFLVQFFEQYPELQQRDFYITGESYAGMYVPYLVDLLLAKPIDKVNLKGFAIGNPLTDVAIDGGAYMDYYYSHAIISRQSYQEIQEICPHDIGLCLFTNSPNCSITCQNALQDLSTRSAIDQFNPYFIYGDVCHVSNTQGASLHLHKPNQHPTATTHRGDIGPCADTYTQAYLNQADLQKAIHVGDKLVHWEDCNFNIANNFTRALSSLPKYKNILGKGLKAMIYSGDADSVVNFIGTERWITEDGLNLTEIVPWQAWFGPDKQVAGFVQHYDGLVFLTVKGAGHMVPTVRPLHGLYMFECFLYGNDACKQFEYPVDPFMIEAGVGPTPTNGTSDNGILKDDSDDAIVVGKENVKVQQAVLETTMNLKTTKTSVVPGVMVMIGVVMIAGVFVARATMRRREYATLGEQMPFIGTTM